MPFCTTSWAALTAWATLGLASNVCGSVLGLLSIAVTRTYLPPIWPITLAYSFSAPTATTWPPGASGDAELAEHAVASSPAATASAAATARRRGRMIGFLPIGGIRGLNTNENDNQYTEGPQPVRREARNRSTEGPQPVRREARNRSTEGPQPVLRRA